MTMLQFFAETIKGNEFEILDKLNIQFVVRLLINISTAIVIIRTIYYRYYRRADLFLTFFHSISPSFSLHFC